MKKVAVITGGSSGIGLKTAVLLKRQGYKVIIIANDIKRPSSFKYQCDVSDEKQVKEVFEKIGEKHKVIDVLINSAGFGISGASELIATKQVQSLYDVNVMGIVHCSKHALPLMKSSSKIINLGSAMAFFPLPFRTMYASSKAAVVTMSYGMRMELKDFGIEVVAVCPGDVKTNFTKNRLKNFKTNEKYGNRVERAATSLDSKEDKRMDASIVARAIVRQVNAKKTKPMIIVGTKYKVLYVLQKLFPTKWMLAIIDKHFNGYK